MRPVFLKTLTLRGFKSFAERTTLVFEPGISVVVGPNGSGKSNVVDAIVWVLGEQGPASLRGGKMEDVIFAGSAARAPLGIAEVELSIDNTAGVLPVEFGEVTISRTLFRSGDSEYRMNGGVCRLLDIQELLSDAGVGRDQHTIVGQGRLDEILGADPVRVRNIIEDAAGVGKHRRRKDRALRKIQACEANSEHLGDLLAEVRSQLDPLRRQAEVADRHERMTRELEGIRVVATARQLAQARQELQARASRGRQQALQEAEQLLRAVEANLSGLEQQRLEVLGHSAARREVQWRLSTASERLRSLQRLAQERVRTLKAEGAAGSEAAGLERVQQIRLQQADLTDLWTEAQKLAAAQTARLEELGPLVHSAREGLSAAENAVSSALQSHAGAVAELRGLQREAGGLAAAVQQAELERNRLREQVDELLPKLDEAAARRTRALEEQQVLDTRSRRAGRQVQDAQERVAGLEAMRSSLLEEVRLQEKRAAVLRASSGARTAPGTAGSTAGHRASMPGFGKAARLCDLMELAPGHRRGLEALVGPLDAVLLVEDRQTAGAILSQGVPEEAVTAYIAGPAGPAIDGATPLKMLATVPDDRGTLLLTDVYVAKDLSQAIELAGRHRHAVFITNDGAVAAGNLVSRGSVELSSQIEQSERALEAAQKAMEDLDPQIAGARNQLSGLMAVRARASAELTRCTEELRRCEAEVQAMEAGMIRAREEAERSGREVIELSRRWELLRGLVLKAEAAARSDHARLEAARSDHARLAGAFEQASGRAEEARMGMGIAVERIRELDHRRERLAAALLDATAGLAGLEDRRLALQAAQEKAAFIEVACELCLRRAAVWAGEAEREVGSTREACLRMEEAIASVRSARAAQVRSVEELRALARDEDLSRNELEVRSSTLEAVLSQQLHVDPDEMVALVGRQTGMKADPSECNPVSRAASMPDEALGSRQVRLERELCRMGSVNPLAAGQAGVLAQREMFLASQIDDLRRSRRDLVEVVESVDQKVGELFASAFQDVAREYERLFRTLFPHGRGRLRLSDPDRLLESGVEVEASPGGRSLRRISLLSGGERALCALALLFSVFKACPSPFYILDEVEAALDDINLRRFLRLLDDFRQTSQLLVVTHQKSTMEIADVLYGVAIRPDGVSKVISQRLRDVVPAMAGLQTDG